MNNIEFCNLVREAKKISGRSNVELVTALQKSESAINHMLKPRWDYSVFRYLPFLKAIGFYISVVNSDGECEKIFSEEDLVNWTKQKVQLLGLSSRKLGEKLETSDTTALRVSNGTSLHLSIFLKLAELTNSKITLDAIV